MRSGRPPLAHAPVVDLVDLVGRVSGGTSAVRRLGRLACSGAVVVGAVALAGCSTVGSASSAATTTVEPRSGVVGVQALDNRFEAKEITITAGSTVRWSNDGANLHDVVPAEGSAFGVKPDAFSPDATYSATFDQPGTYAYYCSLHGTATRGMTGTVTVVEP